MVHLEALREETRLEIRLEELPGGVWLEAHWEVRLAAVHMHGPQTSGGPRGGPAGGGPVHSPGSPVEEPFSPNYHSRASIDPKIDRKHRAFCWDAFCVGVWPKTPGKSRVAFQTPLFSFFI